MRIEPSASHAPQTPEQPPNNKDFDGGGEGGGGGPMDASVKGSGASDSSLGRSVSNRGEVRGKSDDGDFSAV